MRESPVSQGIVELADQESGRIVLFCTDGTYATVELTSWSRVSAGARLFWSHTMSVTGVLFSEGGYRVEYERADWGRSRSEALRWFGVAE
jgi:hypothetical protein